MSILNYIAAGGLEDAPTLYLHGFLGSGADWSGFTDGGFIAPDLPGHGRSVGLPDETYTMEGAAEAIIEILDETQTARCHLVGYSMGGRLALYLALRHPERFTSFVLESASPGLKTERERSARRESDEALARRLEVTDEDGFRAFLEEWHRQPLFASLEAHEGLTEKLVSERLRNDPKELAKSLRGMGTGSQPSLWDELSDLTVPTLAVVGELDGKFVGIAREMSRLSEKIEYEIVAGAGHNVHLEEPDRFVALIRAFVRQNST